MQDTCFLIVVLCVCSHSPAVGSLYDDDQVDRCTLILNHMMTSWHASYINGPLSGASRWESTGVFLGEVGWEGVPSYAGVQLRGLNPYPILGKAGLRNHTLF